MCNSIKFIEGFNMETAKAFFKAKVGVEVHYSRGYKYFSDGYIHKIRTRHDDKTNETTITALCYRSQKKSGPQHEISTLFQKSELLQAHCTCQIGNIEACGHVIGLCYTLQHFLLKGYREVPEEHACTELPQQWGKPRGNKIAPDYVMNAVMYCPKEGQRKKPPISCTLKGNPCTGSNLPSQETISRARHEMIEIHEDIGMAYLLRSSSRNGEVKIVHDLTAAQDSCLHHQLQDYNGGITTNTNIPTLDDNRTTLFYEDFPILTTEAQNIFKSVSSIDAIQITKEEAIDLERETRSQRHSNVWFAAREIRFTASVFGELYRRIKKPNDNFLSRLFGHKDLSYVPSIRHGIQYETEAIETYGRHRSHIKIFPVGLIVHPGAPFLGASPDGHLVDSEAPHGTNGVLEIKCPTWKTLKSGLSVTNSYISESHTGEYKLNSKTAYYTQIQGQMMIAGVNWCDFVIFIANTKEINIERIHIDWEYCNLLFQKLNSLYLNYAVPYLKSRNKENFNISPKK